MPEKHRFFTDRLQPLKHAALRGSVKTHIHFRHIHNFKDYFKD